MFGLIALVTRWGVPPRAAKVVAVTILVALAALLLWGAKALYDHSVIANHDLKVEATQAKADRKADDAAATQRVEDTKRLDQEGQQLKEVLDNDEANPAARKRAFYACIRLQQNARANGLEPPACV